MAPEHALGLLADLTPLRTSVAFRRLLVGRACSALGSHMTAVAVLFQVWRATGSTAWTGAVALAQAVPLVALGPYAGALLDRHDRRRAYLVSVLGTAACSLLLAVQALAVHTSLAIVFALVTVQSAFGAVSGPATRTFVPLLLPAKQIPAGLALQGTVLQLAMLVGPALGGLVIGFVGVGGCYLIDVVTFGVGCFGAWTVPSTRATIGTAPKVAVRAGFAYLLRQPAVRGALLTDLATTVLSFPISVFPLLNAERFADDPLTLGLFLTAMAAGGVVAGALSGPVARVARPGRLMLASSASWGVALVLFALVPQRWVALAMLVGAGAADTLAVVARSTILTLHTPDALRGRVFAAEQIVGQAGPELGNLRAGLVASATSGVASVVSGGVLCLAAVLAVAGGTPALHRERVPR